MSVIFLNKFRYFNNCVDVIIICIDINICIDIIVICIDVIIIDNNFVWYNNFRFRFDLVDSFESGVISG